MEVISSEGHLTDINVCCYETDTFMKASFNSIPFRKGCSSHLVIKKCDVIFCRKDTFFFFFFGRISFWGSKDG